MREFVLKRKLHKLRKKIIQADSVCISFGEFNRKVLDRKKEILDAGGFSRGDYILRVVETQLRDQTIGIRKLNENLTEIITVENSLKGTSHFVNQLWKKLTGLKHQLEQYEHNLVLQEHYGRETKEKGELSFKRLVVEEEHILNQCVALTNIEKNLGAYFEERENAFQRATGNQKKVIAEEMMGACSGSVTLALIGKAMGNQRGFIEMETMVGIVKTGVILGAILNVVLLMNVHYGSAQFIRQLIFLLFSIPTAGIIGMRKVFSFRIAMNKPRRAPAGQKYIR